MVDGVFPSPMVIRRKGQHAGDKSPNVVGSAGMEIGTVTTVVKDNEDAHQEPSSQDGQRDEEPPRNRQAAIHQIPNEGVEAESVDHLPHGPGSRGLLVFRNDLFPRCNVRLVFGRVQFTHAAGLPFARVTYQINEVAQREMILKSPEFLAHLPGVSLRIREAYSLKASDEGGAPLRERLAHRFWLLQRRILTPPYGVRR